MSRICRKCGEAKDSSQFYKDKARRDGLGSWCKACRDATSLAHYRANPEAAIRRARTNYLRRAYGITEDDYDRMLEAQGGACFMCRRVVKHRLHVDHNHKTGHVRALLCTHCNSGLGALREDPKLFQAAADYLNRFAATGLLDELNQGALPT